VDVLKVPFTISSTESIFRLTGELRDMAVYCVYPTEGTMYLGTPQIWVRDAGAGLVQAPVLVGGVQEYPSLPTYPYACGMANGGACGLYRLEAYASGADLPPGDYVMAIVGFGTCTSKNGQYPYLLQASVTSGWVFTTSYL
jgi:hypothetical protein